MDDIRERVARAIANVREGGWPADTYAMLQQHYLTMADAALAEIGEVSVREAALVLLDHIAKRYRIAEYIHQNTDASSIGAVDLALMHAFRAIAEGKDDD